MWADAAVDCRPAGAAGNFAAGCSVVAFMRKSLEHIGAELRRYYSAIVGRPMSWRMIDALVTLEEADERERAGRVEQDGVEAKNKSDLQPEKNRDPHGS